MKDLNGSFIFLIECYKYFMSTLSVKLKRAMISDGLDSYRKAELALGISHSTIQKIVKDGQTRLTNRIKEKLMKFSSEIIESDFTKPKSRGAKPRSKENEVDLKVLLAKYNTNKPTHADILRSIYL